MSSGEQVPTASATPPPPACRSNHPTTRASTSRQLVVVQSGLMDSNPHVRLLRSNESNQIAAWLIHLVLGDLTLPVSESSFLTTATALGVAARRLEAKGGHGSAATRLLC